MLDCPTEPGNLAEKRFIQRDFVCILYDSDDNATESITLLFRFAGPLTWRGSSRQHKGIDARNGSNRLKPRFAPQYANDLNKRP